MLNPVSDQRETCCTFQDSEWGNEFRKLFKSRTPLLPKLWREKISLDPPPIFGISRECDLLYKSLALRAAREREIILQATSETRGWVPIERILPNPRISRAKPTIALFNSLLDNAEAPIFSMKMKFMRGRPGKCCPQALDPMFPPGDPRHPGHPAYPSGHATQAYAMAYVYARIYPRLRSRLLAGAQRIARNREIAGLHYPSDSLAGKKLAHQIVRLLMRNPRFRWQVRAVATADQK